LRQLSRNEGGYLLLESTVAMLVLVLLSVGIASALVDQERLVGEVQAWVKGNPTYFVEPSGVGLERLLGAPAQLLDLPMPPDTAAGGGPTDPNRVDVLSWSSGIDPLCARALVKVTPQGP